MLSDIVRASFIGLACMSSVALGFRVYLEGPSTLKRRLCWTRPTALMTTFALVTLAVNTGFSAYFPGVSFDSLNWIRNIIFVQYLRRFPRP